MYKFGLDTGIQYCKGVGPGRAKEFVKLGVETVGDLLGMYPRDYIFAVHRSISDLQDGEFAIVKGTINRVQNLPHGVVVTIADDTGSVECTWFHMPFVYGVMKRFHDITIWGKVSSFKSKRQFSNPQYTNNGVGVPQSDGGGTPVYPATKKLPSSMIERIIKNALVFVDQSPFYNMDIRWKEVLHKRGFIRINEAMRYIHQPPSKHALDLARKRLIYEEFFRLSVRMANKRKEQTAYYPGNALKWGTAIHERIEKALNIGTTGDQKKVIADIVRDVCKPTGKPMYRLIQGDVGCGKTAVAVYTALLMAVNRKQTVIMCPTKILAQQHYDDVGKMLKDSRFTVGLLTNGTNSKGLRDHIESGTIDVLVATTSVLSDKVKFRDLGLLVVDEEHRFGVKQKGELVKRYQPHQLYMSATPIPKALAATAFGDLDVSTIKEMPGGRGNRETFVILPHDVENVMSEVSSRVEDGGQAYFVYPRIEDAEKAYEYYCGASYGGGLRAGLIHGKKDKEHNEKVVDKFRRGGYNVLMCTSMVEVGVHVENANMMIVHDAHMFGLSQLHQLRGRIGRGRDDASCFLFMDTGNEDGIERLCFLEKCDDGFEVAEKDLEIRGPGELLGTMQHGMPELKLADLITDYKLLMMARGDVNEYA